MNVKYIPIIGLFVIIVGSKLLPPDIYPYVLAPTLALMLYALWRKYKQEVADGTVQKSRYLILLVSLIVCAGMFVYQYYRIK